MEGIKLDIKISNESEKKYYQCGISAIIQHNHSTLKKKN